MGSDQPELEANSTPKLSLYSLPSKPPEPPGMLTPPLNTLASVPFQWEEVPGKPRACTTMITDSPKSKTAARRCLDLPPRLLTEAKVTSMPSPTTVLDGPYVGRSLSETLSFSLGKGSFRSHEARMGGGKRECKERWNFSSWSCGSLKENSGIFGGNFEFSNSADGGCAGGGGESNDTKVKITRIKRRSSFLSLSNARFNLWQALTKALSKRSHGDADKKKREGN
ncbi:hypothetical protein F0562_030976 [Nyssa sinensis]|uniref:Uncharacterized protein n=1 Tax=Nyssa sinensis TaxID=561372 RepID=A0A5J5ASM6_9ASTE|nr:hypothetical protein F0562_030976 [Nyssa sinensis]